MEPISNIGSPNPLFSLVSRLGRAQVTTLDKATGGTGYFSIYIDLSQKTGFLGQNGTFWREKNLLGPFWDKSPSRQRRERSERCLAGEPPVFSVAPACRCNLGWYLLRNRRLRRKRRQPTLRAAALVPSDVVALRSWSPLRSRIAPRRTGQGGLAIFHHRLFQQSPGGLVRSWLFGEIGLWNASGMARKMADGPRCRSEEFCFPWSGGSVIPDFRASYGRAQHRRISPR